MQAPDYLKEDSEIIERLRQIPHLRSFGDENLR